MCSAKMLYVYTNPMYRFLRNRIRRQVEAATTHDCKHKNTHTICPGLFTVASTAGFAATVYYGYTVSHIQTSLTSCFAEAVCTNAEP